MDTMLPPLRLTMRQRQLLCQALTHMLDGLSELDDYEEEVELRALRQAIAAQVDEALTPEN